jgi:hypothetical protein
MDEEKFDLIIQIKVNDSDLNAVYKIKYMPWYYRIKIATHIIFKKQVGIAIEGAITKELKK